MAGSWRIALGVLFSMWATSSASAFGECWYYYSAPMYYYLAPRVIPVPEAAPPAQKIKAARDGAPEIIATRAQSAAAPGTNANELLKVGFWNLTGRDITLTVAGKERTLAKNRTVTIELQREFSWQLDRAAARSERVPDGQKTHEVLIRN